MLSHIQTEFSPSVQPASPLRGYGISGHGSRAGMVADILARAVKSGIPIPDALRALPFYRPAVFPWRFQEWILPLLLLPTFYWVYTPWREDWVWSRKIDDVIRRLEAGESLHAALHPHLRRYLPGYYLTGIRIAEENGTLEASLPMLADQLNYPDSLYHETMLRLAAVAFQVCIFLLLIQFLAAFIVPKFHEIMHDFAPGAAFLVFPAPVLGFLWLLLLALPVIMVLMWMGNRIPAVGDFAFGLLPGTRGHWHGLVLVDVSRSLTAFLAQGYDIPHAAALTQQSTRSRWMRRRMQPFLDALHSGDHWVAAWQKMRVGRPIHHWVLRNAAAREDPQSGFALLTQWLDQELRMKTLVFEKWVSPLASVCLGLVVGLVAYYVFTALTGVLYTLM